MASKTIMDKTWNEKRLQYLGGLLDVQELTDRQSELDAEICSYYIQVRELNRQIDKIRELVTQTIKETMKGEE